MAINENKHILTAQDIQAMANRHGFRLDPGGTAKIGQDRPGSPTCARRTVANEAGIDYSMYAHKAIRIVFEKFGLSQLDQEALEEGFEQFDPDFEEIHKERRNEFLDNYYYCVGQELREIYEKNQHLDVFV